MGTTTSEKDSFIYKIRLIGIGEHVELTLEPNEYEALNSYLVNNPSLEGGLKCFSNRKVGERLRGEILKALDKYGRNMRYQFIGKFKAELGGKS